MPTNRPPTKTPTTLSRPPRITTAMARNKSCDMVQSTPRTDPQTTPAATAEIPANPQEIPIARSTDMPTDQLETWSSDTARNLVPMRLRKNNSETPINNSEIIPPTK